MIAQATAESAQLALAFLDTLRPEQRSRAQLPFAHEARCLWSYFPRHRLLTRPQTSQPPFGPSGSRPALRPFGRLRAQGERYRWAGLIMTVLLDSLDTLKRLRHAFSPARAGEPPRASGRWHRQGLALRDMTPAQRAAAEALLRFSLSETGGQKTGHIRQLETVLREIEPFPRVLIYDPEQYAFSVFGDPRAPP
jgi:hypothetical protein